MKWLLNVRREGVTRLAVPAKNGLWYDCRHDYIAFGGFLFPLLFEFSPPSPPKAL